MGDKIKVILNAFGGRLSKQEKETLVEQAMQAAGLEYHLELTLQAGHGTELAQQAILDGWPIIVAAGGDGTIHEVINGFMLAAEKDKTATLGVIPLGTANDMAIGLQLPTNAAAACQRIAIGNTRLIDIGTVNGHFFGNNSAVGLEPAVTINHEQMRWVKGNLRYILAALKAIVQGQPWQMRLVWDDGTYEGPVNLVSVGNGRRSGGFYMTPQAEMDDGLLDFLFDVGLTRWQLLTLFPKTFNGTHVDHPLVRYLQTRSLSITASPSTPLHTDGEIIDRKALEINYSILPNKLRIIV